MKLPSELASSSSSRHSFGGVCLQIQVCLVRCYQNFSTTMSFRGALATGQTAEETILKAVCPWAQFMVLEGRPAALSQSVVPVHTALPALCVRLLLLRVSHGALFFTSFVVKETESLLEILRWARHSAARVNDGINQINTGKVVPFNSRRNLKKDLNQDCHISTARTHKHTLKAQTKGNKKENKSN